MFTEGAAAARAGRWPSLDRDRPSERQASLEGAIDAAARHRAPGRGPPRRAPVPRADARCSPPHPLRELVTVEGPYPLYADRRARAVRQLVRVLPALRGRHARRRRPARSTSGTFRTARQAARRASPRWASTSIYLPPIHPIGEVNRKGPNNTLTPGPDDTGSPVGDRLQGRRPRRDPPRPRHVRRLRRLRRARPASLGLEVALDLALQAAPDHPWVDRRTRSGSPPAPTARSPTPRTRRRSTRTSTRSTSTTTPTGICREVLRIVRHWMSHGVRIFRVDNPHTKPVAFWEWLLREVRATDPDVLFLSEAFTRPAMMHALGAVGFHQSYTYFTWRTAKWEIEEYLRELSHARPTTCMRPNFFVNTPDILHALPAVRRPGGVQDPRGARRDRRRRAGASTPATSSSSTSRSSPAARSTSTRRSTRSGSATGTRAEAEGRTLAPYLTRLNEIRRAHPALQLLRNVTIHSSDDETCWCSPSSRLPGGSDIVIVRRQPRPARRPRDDRAPRHAGARPGLGRHLHRPRRDHRPGLDWGEHNYVRLDPSTSLPTS